MPLTRISNSLLPSSVSITNITATNLRTNSLQDSSGNTALDVSKVASTTAQGAGRYVRQIINQVDTTDRTSGTSWTAGTELPVVGGFKAGSLLRIYYMYPCRNDSTSWGGIYFEPQIRFNQGTWQSLGSRGYDAVMELGNGSISFTSNSMLINPEQSSDFSVQLRFYFRSYDGSVGINNGNGHDINATSGTANLMSGNNGLQHYGHWNIEELAILRGAS